MSDAPSSERDLPADPRASDTRAICDLLETGWRVVPTFGKDDPLTATWNVISDLPSVIIVAKMPKAVADHIADLHNAHLLSQPAGESAEAASPEDASPSNHPAVATRKEGRE